MTTDDREDPMPTCRPLRRRVPAQPSARPRRALVAALAAAMMAALAPSAPALAASVSYVESGNVFLSAPDGSRRVPITSKGTKDSGYVLAGTADNGVTVASYGPSSSKTWFLFNPNGSLNPAGPNLVPMKTCGSGLGSIGPVAPRLHPSGQLVAYNYFCNYGPPSWGTSLHLAVDNPRDVTLGSNTPVVGTDWHWPTWYGNRLVAGDGVKVFMQENHPDAPFRMGFDVWLYPQDASTSQVTRAEASRQGNRFLADVDSAAGKSVLIGTITGTPPTSSSEEGKCWLATAANPDSATFSPDGTLVAWHDSGGVKVGRLDLGVSNCLVPGSVKLLSASGSTPRFSAYTLPSAPSAPSAPSGGGGGGGGAVVRCVVPKLTGKTLRGAKSALRKANCALGRVTRKRSKARKGRVIAQSPKRRAVRAKGTKVRVVLSRGRR